MRITSRIPKEEGVALITALLATLLATGLMAGMFAALAADQKSHSVDRDQSQAYAAAHAGLEKLTSSLAQLFVTDFSPSATQIGVVDATPPTITGFSYTSPGGSAGSGYDVSFTDAAPADGFPDSNPNADITTGPFTGFKGLITPYVLTVTARSNAGSEVRLRREVQTVAVPVFQFGIFGEKSLGFHAGDDFTFGGRVHTNENLFLAQNPAGTLTFGDRITAVGQVVRQQLSNGVPITTSGHTGNVMVPVTVGGALRNLAAGEGSVTGGPGSAAWSGWKNLSEVTYNTNIRTALTGAKRLDLPLVSQGAVPIDLIRRPAVLSNENTTNPPVYGQRYYSMASLRILLSDRVADLTGLPTATLAAPIPLDGTWVPAGAIPPVARSVGPNTATVNATGGAGGAAPPTGTISFTPAGTPNWLKIGGVAVHAPMTFGAVTVSGCTGMDYVAPNYRLTGCTTAGGAGTTPINTNAAADMVLDAGIGGGAIRPRTGGAASTPAGAGANRAVPIAVATARDLAMGARVIWAGNTPLTCTGYTNLQLTGCTWTAAPAGGTVLSTHALFPAGTSRLGGFIKIEKQSAAGIWTDVTQEILDLGFSAPNQEGTSAPCADPTPNAVLRLQRLRDNGTPGTACTYGGVGGTMLATDFWPNALFDTREATYRTQATNALMRMGGVMNYVGIDVNNLRRWFSGAIGTTGGTALNNNGYIVYFSDRRGNHNDALFGQPETGEYGFEDSLNNLGGAAGEAPNGTLEPGEDRNETNTVQNYGYTPSAVATPGHPGCGVATGAPFNCGSNVLTTVAFNPMARVNPQVFFRRALKVFNGGIGNLPASGLTIATENGIYVQGNYNATAASANVEPNVPAAIIADSITILSNNWLDVRSFISPNDRAGRDAVSTGYRFAMISGKPIPFPKPGFAGPSNWGSDGGVHNFMRMLEDWGGDTVFYRGSMVSLYNARQMVGIFKNDVNVYLQGDRNFSFDTDFLTPALLPPGTPMFRDVNTLKFRQILRPNQ
jgi:hypothetical protein